MRGLFFLLKNPFGARVGEEIILEKGACDEEE